MAPGTNEGRRFLCFGEMDEVMVEDSGDWGLGDGYMEVDGVGGGKEAQGVCGYSWKGMGK